MYYNICHCFLIFVKIFLIIKFISNAKNFNNLTPAPRSILIAVYASNTLRADCLRPFSCKIICSAWRSNHNHRERNVSILSHICKVHQVEDVFQRSPL